MEENPNELNQSRYNQVYPVLNETGYFNEHRELKEQLLLECIETKNRYVDAGEAIDYITPRLPNEG